MRLMGLLALVPVSLLVTLSFFVLFGAEKAAGNALKKLGLAAAVLLWLSAAVVMTGGIMRTVHGGPMHMRGMMGQHERMMMPCMQGRTNDCWRNAESKETPKK